MKELIFDNIFGYGEIKESILLQLVCDLNIILIGDHGMATRNFLTIVKENFDWINCIDDLSDNNISFDKPVLAYSRPKKGRFDPHKTIAEQLLLNPITLNKFDVIFILRDLPDKKRDKEVAESIFEKPAKQDLTKIKKKIIECRKIEAVWSKEAKERIINFYVKYRNQKTTKKDIVFPINSRQLVTIKKIAEGYAKLDGKKEVSIEYSEKALKLLKYYIFGEVYEDE